MVIGTATHLHPGFCLQDCSGYLLYPASAVRVIETVLSVCLQVLVTYLNQIKRGMLLWCTDIINGHHWGERTMKYTMPEVHEFGGVFIMALLS